MEEYKIDYEVKTRILLPKMSKVIMLNDDYTAMDFVVGILREIFAKQPSEAEHIMLKIHTEGKGICGIYPYDIAQTKAREARRRSKEAGFPLRILVEDE
ncbi:ATP-dependent Clp protease adaptor ClpS [Helicobacter sp. MIT 14-3879]|uniref:ATP-dependent Clp protease adaptor ClpS n=1 Tax=Helicobacter sp. MIT 14-3879 TaxID=2040649 RepID=UPI000E1E6574|nr:ATP-dependent Clp protease adaptor ClpS [Helicobacter sp. MIT 14-3879]RDU65515.1 ATP-dependent Clp protease adaptor ClpS [Helicobacter sp. MIT 14-3879]